MTFDGGSSFSSNYVGPAAAALPEDSGAAVRQAGSGAAVAARRVADLAGDDGAAGRPQRGKAETKSDISNPISQIRYLKSDIRNPKSETNSKLKIQMSQTTLNETRRGDWDRCVCFDHSKFEFWICFGFHASDFGFGP
jgi:hypothetical protein